MEILSYTKEYNSITGTDIIKSKSSSFDCSYLLERKKGATSERQDLIQQFVDGINKTAKPKAKWVQVNGQLRHCNTQDLYALLSECNKARCFGSFFWWKVKKNTVGDKCVD